MTGADAERHERRSGMTDAKGGEATAEAARRQPGITRRIEEVMGIPVVIEVADGEVGEDDVEEAFRWLRFVDETFSTYKPGSEMSRLNSGDLALRDAHGAVRSVLARCETLRRQTLGYFDIAAAPPGGGERPGARGSWRTGGSRARAAVDPSGFVKGWAVEGAGRILRRAGAANWSVNAGGDISLHGAPPGMEGWRVGIQHPRERMAVAAVLELSSGAIATSGAYERGAHIVDPHTGRPPEGLLSVTIVGEDLGTVDAYATAAFAMGRRGAEWAAQLPGCGAVVIFDDDTIAYSHAVERCLREPGREPRGAAGTDRAAADGIGVSEMAA